MISIIGFTGNATSPELGGYLSIETLRATRGRNTYWRGFAYARIRA